MLPEEEKLLTLDDIKEKYPPKEETFNGGEIIAEVSRNKPKDEGGIIIYVRPGSVKYQEK